MKERDSRPEQVSKDLVTEIKIFVAKNGGSIRKVLEKGAIWVMSDGAKKYIESLKK